VRQAYVPKWGTLGGPFRQRLKELVGTGTTAYNEATWDVLSASVSVGMQADLVDVASFTAADAAVSSAYPELSVRDWYVINEPVSYRELLARECVLFGYFLSWDLAASKLKLKSAYNHDTHLWTVGLNDSTPAVDDEKPDATSDAGNVANVWDLEFGNDKVTGQQVKFTIYDDASCSGLHLAKSIKIKHPGVHLTGTLGDVEKVVRPVLVGQTERAFPWQRIEVTLAAWLYCKVSTGDVVKVVSSTLPDPYGSGTYGATCLGIVLDVSWNHQTWTGKATVLLYSRYDAAQKNPWAP